MAAPVDPIVPRPPIVAPLPTVVVHDDQVKLRADRRHWVELAAAATRVWPALERPGACAGSPVPPAWQPALRKVCASLGTTAVRTFVRWVASPRARAELATLRPGTYQVAVLRPTGFERVPDVGIAEAA